MSRERREVRDVPDSSVNFVVATMENDGATVTKTSQGDGLWVVTGVFDGPVSASIAPSAEPPVAGTGSVAALDGRTRDVDVLARTLWGEARGGSRVGIEAVAAVVLNRLKRNKPDRFGSTIADVCLKPRQFSCWNPGDPNLQKLKRVNETDTHFLLCIEIAEQAIRGELMDPTEGSDHYHTAQIAPAWSRGIQPVRRIDNHLFYNNIA